MASALESANTVAKITFLISFRFLRVSRAALSEVLAGGTSIPDYWRGRERRCERRPKLASEVASSSPEEQRVS
jgi:hypothetical protein